MIISEYAMKNFIIKDGDSKETILLKQYYLSHNVIDRKLNAEEDINNFNDKYNEIQKLKKNNKTSKSQLELQIAIEDLLN